MTDQPGTAAHLWRYRFTKPDGSEVESIELVDDATAESHARELSSAGASPIRVHRHSGHVEDWEYVIEVDERS